MLLSTSMVFTFAAKDGWLKQILCRSPGSM
jgi:hypothetical protein